MTKYLLLILMGLSLGLSAQTQESDPLQEPPLTESMDEAMSEINKLMESFDLNSLLSDTMLMQSFGGQDLNGLLDSLDLQDLLGNGDMDGLLKEGLPGMEGLDMQQMLEGIDMNQMMKMLEGIDMNEMQKMMEGIDMSEIMKMFEGMDMEGFDGMIPATPQKKDAPNSEDKKLKKI